MTYLLSHVRHLFTLPVSIATSLIMGLAALFHQSSIEATLVAAKEIAPKACQGKVDFAPAYVHIDILEHQKTVKRMDLLAFKADATIVINNGFCLKPTILAGTGHGAIFSGGLGIGHCIPITNRITLTPYVGCTYTHLRTTIDIPMLALKDLKERFRSISPYVSLEATIKIAEGWRICGVVQYAWSRTHTTIKHLLSDKSNAKGPNYALLLEHDLNDKWSVNIGAAYNISLTKEKHGLRGAGVKLGLARWF